MARICFDDYQHHTSQQAVGDKRLGTVDDIVIAIFLGMGAHILQVRPRPRLGHSDGAYQLTTSHARQVLLFLLVGAVVEKIVGHDAVNRMVQTGQTTLTHLFRHHRLVAKVAAGTAIFFWNIRAQESHRSHLAPHLVAHIAPLAGFFIFRRHFSVQEATYRVTEHGKLFVLPARRQINRHRTVLGYESLKGADQFVRKTPAGKNVGGIH